MKLDLVSIPKSPGLINWVNAEEYKPNGPSFTQFLNSAIQDVGEMQVQADRAAVAAVTGDLEEIHQAVIAAEKASQSMQFALQIRNKVLDAYQEIMRMSV